MSKAKEMQRLQETRAWLDGKGKAPHWRTQRYLFDNGFIDFTPTGFTYATQKMAAALGCPNPMKG